MKVYILTEERNVSARPSEGPDGWVVSVHITPELANTAREKEARARATGKDPDSGRPLQVWEEPRCEKCGEQMEAVEPVDNLYACRCGSPAVIIEESELEDWDVDFKIEAFEVEDTRPIIDLPGPHEEIRVLRPDGQTIRWNYLTAAWDEVVPAPKGTA